MSEYTIANLRPTRITLAQRVLAGSLTAATVRERVPDLVMLPSAVELRAAADRIRAAASLPAGRRRAEVASVLAAPAVGAVAATYAAEVGVASYAGALSALDAAAQQVAAEERQLAVSAFVDTLRDDLGLHVSVDDRGETTLVTGERASQVVCAEVSAFGRLSLDIGGCEGGSCRPVQRRIVEGLHRRGLDLEILDRDHHQDPRGGGLLRRREATDPSPRPRRRGTPDPVRETE